MTQEDLRKYVNAQPFRPFRLFLADGNSLGISHPDAIAVASRTAVVIVPGKNGDSDTMAELAIRHITKLERDEPAATGDNGAT